MRKSIVFVAALALAACSNNVSEADDTAATAETAASTDNASVLEGQKPGFEAVAPGTYEVTRAGGEKDFIEIHPGMTYSRVAADGAATGGSIFMKDGKTCFTVEGQEQESCFTDGVREQDGSMKATAANGDVSTVRPVDGTLEDHAKKAA